MAIGICKCGRRTVKHDNCAYTFRWLCETCRSDINKREVCTCCPINVYRWCDGGENCKKTLLYLFNSLKRSA